MFFNYGNRKPPMGSILNRAHPLAYGMVGCFLLNEMLGNTINNLAANQTKFSTSYGNAAITSMVDGSYILYGNYGSYGGAFTPYIAATEPMGLPLNPPLTWAFRGIYPSGKTGSQGFLQIIHSIPNAVPYLVWSTHGANSGLSYYPVSYSTGGTEYSTTSNFPGYNIPMSVASYITTTGYAYYENGVKKNVSSVSIPGFNSTSTSTLIIGAYPVLYGYVWNRQITDYEAAWINAEPFAMIDPPPIYKYFSIPTIAPPSGQNVGSPVFWNPFVAVGRDPVSIAGPMKER